MLVNSPDRLGRDTRDVLNIIHDCDQRQAFVAVPDPHVTTRGEASRIVLTVLGMVAQMERRLIKERERGGIVRAKAELHIKVITGGSPMKRCSAWARKGVDLQR